MASNTIVQSAARKSSAMGPSVRNLLGHYNLDPSLIASTGPHQTLLKSDVVKYIHQHNLQPGQQQNAIKTPSKKFTSNLDFSGYQPKPGPEGFSKIAKKLLDM